VGDAVAEARPGGVRLVEVDGVRVPGDPRKRLNLGCGHLPADGDALPNKKRSFSHIC
jgi:hypothetical protein